MSGILCRLGPAACEVALGDWERGILPSQTSKNHLNLQQSFNLYSAEWTRLTELPGELSAALQSRVAERVPAVHQPGVGQSFDTPQGQQVGVLQPRAPRTVQDAPLQGAKAAILRVAEDFDTVGPHQVIWQTEPVNIPRLDRDFPVNQLFLTLGCVFEQLAATAVLSLRRPAGAVGPASRRLYTAAPAGRLHAGPSHQILHPHHHFPGHCQNFVLTKHNIRHQLQWNHSVISMIQIISVILTVARVMSGNVFEPFWLKATNWRKTNLFPSSEWSFP